MTTAGKLAGKVAFITGAGSGIAKASARLFAAEGASVAIVEKNETTGLAIEAAIKEEGGRAVFIHTDVTSDESVRAAVERTLAEFGSLNILYSCAGGSVPQDGLVTEIDLSVFQHTVTFDLLSAILCSRYAIPEIIKAGGGTVINMSSAAALMGSLPRHVYTASKGAIISLTRSLAADYALQGVRVNAIAPGIVMTERTSQGTGIPPALTKMFSLLESHPFAKGEAIDIANIALFLASEDSRMITGVTIAADGGFSAY